MTEATLRQTMMESLSWHWKREAQVEALLLELCDILEVPMAPAGVNGMYRPEDILARARELKG